MKVSSARCCDLHVVVVMPMPNTLRSGIHTIDTIHNVVVELEDGDGIGVGYAYAFSQREARSIQLVVQDLLELIADLDWHDVGIFGRPGTSLPVR